MSDAGPGPTERTPIPAEQRPLDHSPVATVDLPPTPQRDRSIPATAWTEAPTELLGLGTDLTDLDGTPGATARYLRRIGPWLLWRAGPARGARARYWAALADDLTTQATFDLFPDGTGSGTGPSGAAHVRFRTWKEDLRDHAS